MNNTCQLWGWGYPQLLVVIMTLPFSTATWPWRSWQEPCQFLLHLTLNSSRGHLAPLKCKKTFQQMGLCPGPTWKAYSTPQTSKLVKRGLTVPSPKPHHASALQASLLIPTLDENDGEAKQQKRMDGEKFWPMGLSPTNQNTGIRHCITVLAGTSCHYTPEFSRPVQEQCCHQHGCFQAFFV